MAIVWMVWGEGVREGLRKAQFDNKGYGTVGGRHGKAGLAGMTVRERRAYVDGRIEE